ncbi:MAG TPA: alginate lyase family protein [Puia sp.]|nr:alginate lyase family protein [Puia sp.]
MKQIIIASVLCMPLILRAQQHKLEKLWETDTVIAVPESTLPDYPQNILYVSLIDGGGWDADGKGGVGKLGLDGQHYVADWITGLNAPKGLGRWANHLYAADISEVVVIDIQKGKIEKKIPIEGASGLNDITVDGKGVVYVSDSKTGKVHKIENGIASLYMDNLPGVNGLKSVGDDLYILAKKAVLKADASKNIKTITDLPNGGDGIEPVGNGDFIVTEWVGYVYYVYADGKKELLLDTHLQKKNTADIGYDPVGHILYVPGFNAKTVTAYRLVFLSGGGPAAGDPRVLLMDASRLAELKKKAEQQDAAVLSLVSGLQAQADSYMSLRHSSVMDKPVAPPSGSKHDYMSQAPYFWYDSSKPKGLPYLRRDGQRNPEIYTITDHRYMSELDNASRVLALAWYFTGQEKYAMKAATLLRHWFLDDSTRMNPNLNYAQAVPGVNDGRGTGIIESIALTGIADAAGLLEGSRSWTAADAGALRQWYTLYLDWMLTSKNGKDEHAARNNHGTWYLAQAADFALFTGDVRKARELAEEGKQKMDEQVEKDGKMPLELARTNGLGYSTYNLQAWFKLSILAERTETDLWNYRNKEGAGIRTALDWLEPYALGERKWDYQQISSYNRADYSALLLQAATKYKESRYLTYARSAGEKKNTIMTALLYRE